MYSISCGVAFYSKYSYLIQILNFFFAFDFDCLFSAVFPNFTMNDTTELLDNWDNFEEPILEIDFEENVVAEQGNQNHAKTSDEIHPYY
jgi:hypothetical protein